MELRSFSSNFLYGKVKGLASAILISSILGGCLGQSGSSSKIPTSISPKTNTQFKYVFSTAVYFTGVAISGNSIQTTSTNIIAYTISPSLPAGLSFNSKTGKITGTPTTTSSQTTYTVQGSTTGSFDQNSSQPQQRNLVSRASTPPSGGGAPPSGSGGSNSGSAPGGGSAPSSGDSGGNAPPPENSILSTEITITVIDSAPTSLSYSTSSGNYFSGTTILSNSPTYTGGAPTSYSISPSLPTGLSLDTSTGIISGTPEGSYSTTTYNITASNSGGSVSTTITIKVTDSKPSNLTYSQTSASYSQNSTIVSNIPSNSGGTITNYTVSPSLPNGLSLDPSTGYISGAPTTLQDAETYTITGSNQYGYTSVSISITVITATPKTLTYSNSNASYSKNITITNNVPTSTGGPISNYSITPDLPQGLSLNSTTGIISGTPLVTSSQTTYLITGSNQAGGASVAIKITINETPPTGLTYNYLNSVYIRGSSIVSNSPNTTGGTPTAFSVNPSLPSGLSLNSSTGIISGNPSVVSTAASYVVTASNTGGSAKATLNITVNDIAPTNLNYSNPTSSYYRGQNVTNSPSNLGGTILSYTISPSLPTGLILNSSTGLITGSPTVILAASNYTVTGTNSGGNTSVQINITITDVAPTNLVYSATSPTFSKGVLITPVTPSNSGGFISTYNVSPSLPSGISLNSSTGIISGTPSVLSGNATYIVSGSNSSGSISSTLNITVNDVAPSNLVYTPMNPTFIVGTSTSMAPNSSGGTIINYSISPSLPAGLTFSSVSGVISGTPTTITPIANYEITATNSGGSTISTLSIKVVDAPPTNLSYTYMASVYTKNSTIAGNTPTYSGGTILSFSISPSLPSGLNFNSSTGLISGTPTTTFISTPFVVTGSNTGGTASATLNITINDASPTSLIYTDSNPIYYFGSSITANSPSNSGGTITSYSISPSLPTGLTFNSTTGILSGTPSSLMNATTFYITGINSGGSTFTSLSITIANASPTQLSYSNQSAIYTKGSTITANAPTNTGGLITTYAISPSLPSGISLDATSGVITGTPAVIQSTSSFVVTGSNASGSTTSTLSITVNDIPPTSLSYTFLAQTHVKGSSAITNFPSSNGGAAVSYSISPSLPNGLTVDSSTGIISGTPSILSAAANYTITATNSGGSTTAVLTLAVVDVAPSALTYTLMSPSYLKGSSISDNTPSTSGGPIVSYIINPALPSGLNLNSSTGIISGTPITAKTLTSYVVTATNSGGSALATLSITVTDVEPTNLTYSFTSPIYTKGVAISQNVPSNSGGTIITYLTSPSLPTGITLNSSTGVISGTPISVTNSSSYTITGTNSGGSTTTTLNITVNDSAPYSLNYSENPTHYIKGSLITVNLPTNLGGTITSYSVSPSLPSGLSLNSSTGYISGTPTVFFSGTQTYVVTGTNSGGITSVNLNIMISDTAPTDLAYSSMSSVYTKGTTITTNSPSNSGGTATSYVTSSSLPAGLNLNSTSGLITGTPTSVSVATPYVITASNGGGFSTATLNITVIDVAPNSLTYPTSVATFVRGAAITNDTPTNGGGSVTAYTVSPTLPAGLTLNSTTGVISGTPSALSDAANYVVTASNSGGSSTATLNFTVIDVAPSNLTYNSMDAYYAKNSTIVNNTPTNSGGTAIGFTVSPSLPTGLALDSSTGIISGTPTTIQSVASYVVTASNTGGSASATLQITINDAPPTLLTYPSMSPNYVKDVSITNNTPSNTGGVITSYSVSPSLPAGLTLNSTNGIISGTPTTIVASNTYIVTGSNISGSATANLVIAVNDVPPTGLSYSQMAPTYTNGTAITDNTPTISGGTIISYTISPPLPSGLNLNSTSGIISGIPSAISVSTPYVITATNSGGDVSATLNITVNDVAPSALTYTFSTAVYTKGTVIATNTPSASGGAIINFSSSPALPGGLNLNSSTGVITGTPAAVVSAANYTITATNSGGSTTATLNFTVKDVIPSNLTYTLNPAVYVKNTAISSNSPTNLGGTIVTYSISPSLPLGLTLNSSTGVITGTPTGITSVANYVVTGTNTGGNTTATLSVTVNDAAPTTVSYSYTSYQFLKGSAIVSLSASHTGGTPTSYSVSPTLPTGLSVNSSTGLLSGTPSSTKSASNYVVTGSNITGSASATLSITVTQTQWVGNIATTPASGATSGCGSASTGTFSPGWCTGGTASSGNSDGKLNNPNGSFVDSSGYLYIADTSNHRISKYDSVLGTFVGWIGRVSTSPSSGASGCSSTATGAATPGWCTGGTSQSGTSDGMYNTPTAVTGDGTFLYIVDQGNRRIIKVNASTGAYIGWAGLVGTVPTGGASGCTSVTTSSYTNLWCTGGAASTATTSSAVGGFNLPVGATMDSTNTTLYVVDQSNSTLNKYTASTAAFGGWIGRVGNTRPTSGVTGCNTNANRNGYTVGWCIGGSTSTGNGDGSFNLPSYVASDSTNLYVSNSTSDQVGKYTASSGAFVGWIGSVGTIPTGGATGCTSTAVGSKTPGWCTGGASTAGTGDGMFTNPTGIAVTSSGILYISDSGNNRIMKYSASAGTFTGWTGNILTSPTGGDTGCSGASVGTGTLGWCTGGTAQSGAGNAMFNTPQGISRDSSGNLLIPDSGNSRIVKLIP